MMTYPASAFAGMRRAATKMSDLERRYREHLAKLKLDGMILDFQFEKVKLRIDEKCFYTPDFLVVTHGHVTEFHETKGYRREDAIVKLRAAAALFPGWRFLLVEYAAGDWKFTDFTTRHPRS